jgi:CRP-like cAMP-binding protein/Ca2+-binding EF-hand superfamily protein/thiol-disulfide isomerase/thioredoxin
VSFTEVNNVAAIRKEDNNNIPNFPELVDGIYALHTPEEHTALMEYAADKLVVLKIFAPWCRACKALEPKFAKLSQEPSLNDGIPILWASLSIQHNKAFVQSLGVLALPTVQFYVGGKLLDTFPCGPSKVPILTKKLDALVHDHVVDGIIKPESIQQASLVAEQNALSVKERAAAQAAKKQAELLEQQQEQEEEGQATIPPELRKKIAKIPYFESMSLADLDHVLDQAVPLTFQPGSIIVREGKMGRMFYVIESGEIEICQQTLHDPLGSYLGTVINRLGPGDYFGERALITGEPRAASLRASTEPVTVWGFDKDAFPASCVLSGQTKHLGSSYLEAVDSKYGIDLLMDDDRNFAKQVLESATANQIRGSVNTPQKLLIDEGYEEYEIGSEVDGVDVDELADSDFITAKQTAPPSQVSSPLSPVAAAANGGIFSVLTRFQMIRHVSTCFKYIQETKAVWGEPGIRRRRNMLVARLSKSQRTEFTEAFKLIDVNGDGVIEIGELKRVLKSIGEGSPLDTNDLRDVMSNGIIQQPNPMDTKNGIIENVAAVKKCVDEGSCPSMNYDDFMGLMAEAEFYHLFRDIFASLDENNSGYVKARELDRVLCGVRDLISDDRGGNKSVIDVEDKDMLVDYEQFSRMLLGTSLVY